jgi:hypothetical protein
MRSHESDLFQFFGLLQVIKGFDKFDLCEMISMYL